MTEVSDTMTTLLNFAPFDFDDVICQSNSHPTSIIHVVIAVEKSQETGPETESGMYIQNKEHEIYYNTL